MQSKNSIKAEKLSRKFGNFTAVDAISFEVKKGEIFGFLGANGAGKTTAIRMLVGLLKPTSGKAEVAGIDVTAYPEKVKQKIGYMSQKFSLYRDLTVYENFRFYGGIYGLSLKRIKQKYRQAIEELELQDIRDSLVADIPLGWKQKLAFALAKIHDPGIVFLDEPTSGVDPITRRRFWEQIYAVAEVGMTVFVTTHYMEEAEYCNRISLMVEGKIVALDKPRKLKERLQVDTMEEVFVNLVDEE